MLSLFLAALLSSNASGKTIVRAQPGTLVARPVLAGPVLVPDSNTIAHVWFNGSRIVDRTGNAWAMTGTVPQVAKSPPIPAGAGPTSAGNIYTLGSGSDPLDAASDFTVCVVWVADATTGEQILVSNLDGTNGWAIETVTPSRRFSVTARGCSAATVTNTPPAGSVSVGCAGRSGNNWLSKLNLGTIATVSACGTYAGNCASGANCRAALGVYLPLPGLYQGGTILEVWFSSTTPTDAAFASYMNVVKSKLGITAW